MTSKHLPIVSECLLCFKTLDEEESHKGQGLKRWKQRKGQGHNPGISQQNVSLLSSYFTPRSFLSSSKEALRIGRLLYLPATPTGRDGACWEILHCFGIKPTSLESASTLGNWDWESNHGSAYFLKKPTKSLKPDFTSLLQPTSFSFMSMPQLQAKLLVLKQEKLGKKPVQNWGWTASLKIPTNVLE